jgi:hypothetical protein
MVTFSVISAFRRDVDENCALLGYYAASSGYFLPTFRDNPPVLSLWDRQVVPKRREEITTTRCLVIQKSAVLKVILSHSISVLGFCCYTATLPVATCVLFRI